MSQKYCPIIKENCIGEQCVFYDIVKTDEGVRIGCLIIVYMRTFVEVVSE